MAIQTRTIRNENLIISTTTNCVLTLEKENLSFDLNVVAGEVYNIFDESGKDVKISIPDTIVFTTLLGVKVSKL